MKNTLQPGNKEFPTLNDPREGKEGRGRISSRKVMGFLGGQRIKEQVEASYHTRRRGEAGELKKEGLKRRKLTLKYFQPSETGGSRHWKKNQGKERPYGVSGGIWERLRGSMLGEQR